MDVQTVTAVKEAHSADLMALPGVHSVSVAVVDGEPVIRLYYDSEDVLQQLPEQVEGVPVDRVFEPMDEHESIRPATPQAATEQTSYHRPIRPGVSMNHVQGTACTSNFVFTDGSNEYIGGNNHCFARRDFADPGDWIIQPSRNDGGTLDHRVGVLEDYVPIRDGMTVDFAWASIDDDVPWTGEPLGFEGSMWRDPERAPIYRSVEMSGRTSGFLDGTITEISVSARVNFGNDRVITVEDCFRSNMPTQGGDSGSPVIMSYTDGSYAPVGVHFAGTDDHATHCQVVNVFEETPLEDLRIYPDRELFDEPVCIRDYA